MRLISFNEHNKNAFMFGVHPEGFQSSVRTYIIIPGKAFFTSNYNLFSSIDSLCKILKIHGQSKNIYIKREQFSSQLKTEYFIYV